MSQDTYYRVLWSKRGRHERFFATKSAADKWVDALAIVNATDVSVEEKTYRRETPLGPAPHREPPR